MEQAWKWWGGLVLAVLTGILAMYLLVSHRIDQNTFIIMMSCGVMICNGMIIARANKSQKAERDLKE